MEVFKGENSFFVNEMPPSMAYYNLRNPSSSRAAQEGELLKNAVLDAMPRHRTTFLLGNPRQTRRH